MESKIFIEDQLKEVAFSLTGVSQLLRHTYEMRRLNGEEGEHLVVLDDTICQCSEKLIDLTKTL